MDKKFAFFILLALTSLLGFEGCKKKEQIQKSQKDVIAQVDDALLTERDLELAIPEAQRDIITLEQKRDLVGRWIQSQILYQAAIRKKTDQDETVRWQIDQAVRNTIIEAFLEKELGDRVKVSEDEARQYYQQNKNMFRREEDEVRLHRILVGNVAEAGLVKVRIEGGESFDTIAKGMSLDETTKERGGDVGYVLLSDLPPEFQEAAMRLSIGEVSGPIQTEYGIALIMITDRKAQGSIREYELVKSQIINSLILNKKRKELEDLFEQLKKEAKVQTFDWADGVFPKEQP
jgi:peptidyl-prolyl cis-trans isomerase C